MQPPFIIQAPNAETPETSDPNVKVLIDKIHLSQGGILPNASAQIIEIQPGKGAEENECFIVVEEKVRRDGGSCVLGWDFRYDGFLMIATFHAVWKDPKGNLLDITPKLDNREQILFVDAPNAKYEGKQVFDIILNHTQNPLADDFIACLEAVFDMENKGERAYQHAIALTRNETQLRMGLEMMKMLLSQMIYSGKKSRSDPCVCKSNIKFEDCCGKALKKLLKQPEQPS